VAMQQPFDQALSAADELELTVTGRKTGRPSTRPVWFVQEGDTIHLLPVAGSDTEWFKNGLKNSTITLTATGASWTGRAIPTTNPAEVREVVEKFQKKYGAGEIAKYYSKRDVAVRVPLVA
jgi:hypothetical protein